MSTKILTFNKLNLPKLKSQAEGLPTEGVLATSENRLTYLDIDDAFIHQLYPILKEQQDLAESPAYFGQNLAGAHISVIYPEENVFVDTKDLGKAHHFKVKDAYTADLDLKRYYVLLVQAESLVALRQRYGLPQQLCFKNHWLDLHITIATTALAKKRKS